MPTNIAISANERPIYPRTIFNWAITLLSEVAPILVTTQVPQLIGNGETNGALIHGMEVQSLGDNSATSLILYTQSSSSQGYTSAPVVKLNYFPLCKVPLPIMDSFTNIPIPLYDILPTGNKGYHLAPAETLYAALETAIETGIVLRVRGGWY